MYYYLPSCKIKELHPETSRKLQKYLSGRGVTVSGCCKASQKQFQEGDIILTNCTSCAIITDEQSPECREISLYEYLLEDEGFLWPDYHGERITVQDCYRAVHKPQVQSAVRECLKKMDMVPVEIEENFENTRFDGVFRYQRIQPGNLKLASSYFEKAQEDYIEILDEEEIRKQMKEWAKQYETKRVTVYCNSCLKGLQMTDVNAIHILDLLARDLEE